MVSGVSDIISITRNKVGTVEPSVNDCTRSKNEGVTVPFIARVECWPAVHTVCIE